MSEVRRKKIRLPGSVYETGWYFVTICTKDRREILSVIRPTVGADDSVRPCGVSPEFEMSLTPVGGMVQKCLERLRNEAEGVLIDKYVIMPNHLHVIICLEKGEGGQSRPPLQRVMQRFKSITTRYGWSSGCQTLWQRSYYDHVIRNDADYLRAWQYIDDNPAQWAEDEYYSD